MEDTTTKAVSSDCSKPNIRMSSLYNAYIVTMVMKDVVAVESMKVSHFSFFVMMVTAGVSVALLVVVRRSMSGFPWPFLHMVK